MDPSETTTEDDQTPAERPAEPPPAPRVWCPYHPDAPQTDKGCTVSGCTWSAPETK